LCQNIGKFFHNTDLTKRAQIFVNSVPRNGQRPGGQDTADADLGAVGDEEMQVIKQVQQHRCPLRPLLLGHVAKEEKNEAKKGRDARSD
jgi:hypothetical protein